MTPNSEGRGTTGPRDNGATRQGGHGTREPRDKGAAGQRGHGTTPEATEILREPSLGLNQNPRGPHSASTVLGIVFPLNYIFTSIIILYLSIICFSLFTIGIFTSLLS